MTPAGEEQLGLIGIDGSPDSIALVSFVRRAFHPSWRWLVVHVVDLTAPAHPDTTDQLESDAASVVEEASRLLPGSTAILEHSPDTADGLRTVARDHDVSAIVIGSIALPSGAGCR